MAVYKIFPTQDATLYSAYPTMNTGLNAILETSNTLDISGNPDVSRYLIKFDTAEIIDIISNKISGSSYDIYFKNFIAEAQGINLNTSLEILPVAQDWNNGTGEFLDSPITTNGASWNFSNYGDGTSWSIAGFIGIVNLLNKVDAYENFILDRQESYEALLQRIRDIDSKEIFENDDEVGFTFDDIKN